MKLALKKMVCSRAMRLTALLFGTSCGASGAPGVQASAPLTSPLPQVQTAYLECQEVNYSVATWNIRVVTQNTPFKKEPAFAGRSIIRGTLQFGGNASNSIPFVWDSEAGRLYLDLNRNLDLTDDPAGIFARQTNRTIVPQTFAGVRLPLQTPSGVQSVVADLSLWNSGSFCYAAVRSFWQGKVTLGGEDFQVGIVENSFEKPGSADNGHLLLRPWELRNQPFDTSPGSLATVPFSRKLFVHDHAYQLDCAAEPGVVHPRLKLQFAEQQPALGELKIAGDFVQRVTLLGGPWFVVIDKPESAVKVPAGSYNQFNIYLKNGDIGAYRTGGQKRITIEEKKLAVLTAGGPLTNSVAVSRRGDYLNFNYQLLGAGGEAYQLAQPDRAKPPEFVVYRGGKKIASGKFEFG